MFVFLVVVLERTSQSHFRKSTLNIHWKDWSWSWSSNTLATWCEELTHWERPWFWERVKVGGEGVDRGWNGWMASLTRWTWVWAVSGSWWWTGKPCMLQYMGSQKSWAWLSHWTELNWRTLGFEWMRIYCKQGIIWTKKLSRYLKQSVWVFIK